ncbi:hypothetical protein OSTOST_00933 [Ostertagia ostertagi]
MPFPKKYTQNIEAIQQTILNTETTLNMGNINVELLDWNRHITLDSAETSIAYALRFLRDLCCRVQESCVKNNNASSGTQDTTGQQVHHGKKEKEKESCITKQLKRSLKNLNVQPDPYGILRCRGRLDNANVPESAKHPILSTLRGTISSTNQKAGTESPCILAQNDGKRAGNHEPREGMVLLLADDNLPRNPWKMGRISALKPGKDGAIREVELHMPNGNIPRRPINLLLIPLELNDGAEPPRENQQPESGIFQRAEQQEAPRQYHLRSTTHTGPSKRQSRTLDQNDNIIEKPGV